MPVAYSYLRFSSPQQAAGDSVRRQTAAAAAWCERNKVVMDTTLNMKDAGVSAYKGAHTKNADTHALAGFLEAVRQGRVPRGAYLIVESLDRLSREDMIPALMLLFELVTHGVKVVQLAPVEVVYAGKVDMAQLMMAAMELSRGNSESEMKSQRVGAAWANKRKEAATKLVTRKVPGWIAVRDGKPVLDEVKAAVVRRIFALCIDGHGVQTIARTLNTERVPVMGRKAVRGRKVAWNETVVYHVLISRAAYGEYQPHKGRGSTRTPSGPPIENYYPAAVTYTTYLKAAAALRSRARASKGVGRRGKHVNIFSGLLIDDRDGGSFTYRHRDNKSSLGPVGAKQGKGTKWSSFPVAPFEEAILSQLREISAADVLGEVREDDRVRALESRKAELAALIEVWAAKMTDINIADLVAAKLSEFGVEAKKVQAELTAARTAAASPAADALSEFRSAASLLADDNSDEMRLRVKAAVRRVVKEIRCAFAHDRELRVSIAHVRVVFSTGAKREYAIIYRQAAANGRVKRPGKVFVRSRAAGANQRLGYHSDEMVRQWAAEVLGVNV